MTDKEKNYEGKDPKTGQFVKGWKGGPGQSKGNPFVNELRKAARPEVRARLIETLLVKAIDGDPKFMAIALKYVAPNPCALDKGLTGDLADQLGAIKELLTGGSINHSDSSALTRIVLSEEAALNARKDGKKLTAKEIVAMIRNSDSERKEESDE